MLLSENLRETIKSVFIMLLLASLWFGLAVFGYNVGHEFRTLSVAAFGITFLLGAVCVVLNQEKGPLIKLARFFSYTGAVLLWFSLLNSIPLSRALHIPLFPDARINVVHTEVREALEKFEKKPDHLSTRQKPESAV